MMCSNSKEADTLCRNHLLQEIITTAMVAHIFKDQLLDMVEGRESADGLQYKTNSRIDFKYNKYVMSYILTNIRAIKILSDHDSYYVYRAFYFPCFEDQENPEVSQAIDRKYYSMRNWPSRIPSHYRVATDMDTDSYAVKKICALNYVYGMIDVESGYSCFTWSSVSCHDSKSKYYISNGTLIIDSASFIADAFIEGISPLKKWNEFNAKESNKGLYMQDDFDRVSNLYKVISEIPMEDIKTKMKEVFSKLSLNISVIESSQEEEN